MKSLPSFFLVTLFFFTFASSISALEIPPPTSNYVNDYASLLSAEAKERLELRLRKLGSETSTQIVVATFPSLEDENLEDFTNRMYEAWRIGEKGRDNGVLLGIFEKERRVRIEVGYGLEGVLTDALSAQIIQNEFVPNFRAGNPEQGIENTVVAIEKAVRGEYKVEETKPERLPPLAAILLILILIVVMYRLSRRGFTIGPVARRGRDWDGGFFSGGGWRRSGGFGGYSSDDSGGGGFGGFSGGGGLSGGGGASGSW